MLARFYESFALYMQSPQAMTGQAQHALKNYLYGLETSVGSQGTAHDPRQNASLEQLKTQLSLIEAQYPYPQFMLGHYAHQTKAYIEAFQQRSTTTEPQNATGSGKDTTLELELDLAKVMISQDTAAQEQGATVLLGLLAHKQFEEALKKKLQAEALKKAEQEAAKTAVKLSLKWGARLAAVVGMVLTPDQAHAPGTPLPIPKGYVLVKEGMFAGQLIKKLYISATEAERVGKELQKMLQMTSAAPQSHLLEAQLRHLIFAFRSRLPQGPIDPNKHRLEQYEDWGLEKMVDFLVKNYPRLNSHEKDRIRELLKANQAEKGLGRLAKVQAVYDTGMPDPDQNPEGALWYLLSKEGRGEKLSVQEQELVERLALKLGLAPANDWLIPSSEERRPKEEGGKGLYQKKNFPFENTLFRGHIGFKENYVDIYVDDFEKVDKQGSSSLEFINQVATRMARDEGLEMIMIRFDNVYNKSLKNNANNWAQKYGYEYKFIDYEVDERKVPMVIWIKYIF
jgi:hypothetical protein